MIIMIVTLETIYKYLEKIDSKLDSILFRIKKIEEKSDEKLFHPIYPPFPSSYPPIPPSGKIKIINKSMQHPFPLYMYDFKDIDKSKRYFFEKYYNKKYHSCTDDKISYQEKI